jgi:hypothetical protein
MFAKSMPSCPPLLARILVASVLALGPILATAPARAQTYDPSYPVCLQTYSPRGGGYIDCRFTSLEQCRLTASGRAAQCYLNPYFPAELPRPVRSPHHRAPYR